MSPFDDIPEYRRSVTRRYIALFEAYAGQFSVCRPVDAEAGLGQRRGKKGAPQGTEAEAAEEAWYLETYTVVHALMSATRQSDGPPSGQASRARIVGKLLPSDLLPALVGLAQRVSALSPILEGYVKFHLVLDANIIQGELRWRLGKREKPHARTGLHEAIMSGVLVAYVPAIVEQEILEHVEEIALGTRSSVEDVHRELRKLWPLLRVHKALAEPVKVTQVVDRDDVPYIATRSQLGLRAV